MLLSYVGHSKTLIPTRSCQSHIIRSIEQRRYSSGMQSTSMHVDDNRSIYKSVTKA